MLINLTEVQKNDSIRLEKNIKAIKKKASGNAKILKALKAKRKKLRNRKKKVRALRPLRSASKSI